MLCVCVHCKSDESAKCIQKRKEEANRQTDRERLEGGLKRADAFRDIVNKQNKSRLLNLRVLKFERQLILFSYVEIYPT